MFVSRGDQSIHWHVAPRSFKFSRPVLQTLVFLPSLKHPRPWLALVISSRCANRLPHTPGAIFSTDRFVLVFKTNTTPTHAKPCPQLENHSPETLVNLSAIPAVAPVGINPECGIYKAGELGSLGNIANMIVCGVSMIVVFVLIVITTRRRAAVGASFLIFRAW